MTTDPTRAQADEALMRRCLNALEDAIDDVVANQEARAALWKGYPSRAIQVAAGQKLVDEHNNVMVELRQRLATPVTHPSSDELRTLVTQLRPYAAFGRPGSRDVEQGALQRLLDIVQGAL